MNNQQRIIQKQQTSSQSKIIKQKRFFLKIIWLNHSNLFQFFKSKNRNIHVYQTRTSQECFTLLNLWNTKCEKATDFFHCYDAIPVLA